METTEELANKIYRLKNQDRHEDAVKLIEQIIQSNRNQLTESEEARRGALLAKVLLLKPNKGAAIQGKAFVKWVTEWGTKTDLGLFRIVKRIIEDGE